MVGFMRIIAGCLAFTCSLAVVAGTTSALAQSAPAAKEDPLATCQARVRANDQFVSDIEQKLNTCAAKLNPNPQLAEENVNALKNLGGQLDGLFDRIDKAVSRLGAERP